MESLLDHTNPYDKGHNWTYPVKQCPDAIILLIGPNDYLEGDKPDEIPLQKAYLRLLEMQRFSYRKCARAQSKVEGVFPMILVCGGSGNGLDPCRLENRIDELFNQRHQGSAFKVHYVSMNHTTWHRINDWKVPDYLGCDKHYNAKGHQVLKDEIFG